jgi:hypothetical protein
MDGRKVKGKKRKRERRLIFSEFGSILDSSPSKNADNTGLDLQVKSGHELSGYCVSLTGKPCE